MRLSLGYPSCQIDFLRGTENREGTAWLFPSENGKTPLGRDNVWRRNIPACVERGEAPFQVLRTYATLSWKRALMQRPARIRWVIT